MHAQRDSSPEAARDDSRAAADSAGGRRRRALLAWALTLTALVACLAEALPPGPPLDDAFISYRYARNLGEGVGLVYNEGEYVEGITNLAWTLTIAAGVRAGYDAVDVGGMLEPWIAAALLIATFLYARRLLPPRRVVAAALAPLAVLAAPGFSYWTTAGLGEGLFIALVVATLAAEVDRRLGMATVLAFAATLVRPEGALVASCVFLAQALRGREALIRALPYGLAYASALMALTGFRLWYYGSPVPNTFFAKVGGIPIERGAAYLGQFLAAGAWPLALVGLPAALAADKARPAALYVVLTAAYAVYVGGDVFPLGRFLLPTLPLLAAFGVHAASRLWDRHRMAGAAAALAIAGSIAIQVTGTPLPGPASLWPPAALHRSRVLAQRADADARMWLDGRTAAERLSAISRERGYSPLVAAGVIGALGYHSRLPILDLFGLVDPIIARHDNTPPAGALVLPGHSRSHPDYVLERRPAYIVMEQTPGAGSHPAMLDLAAHPGFRLAYIWDPSVPAYRRLPAATIRDREAQPRRSEARPSGD